MTPTKFSIEIENLVKTSNGLITYVEAVVTYCQENEIEIETVAQIVKKSSILKEKIRTEAVTLRMVEADDEPDITDHCK